MTGITSPEQEWILILDYGSQYNQLIARRIRENQVYCEIHPFDTDLKQFSARPPGGIILSGGPMSVNDPDAPAFNKEVLDLNVPVLGICYGLQAMAHHLKPGSVSNAEKREYGRAKISVIKRNALFAGIPDENTVWMSHGDHIIHLPDSFDVIARTDNAPVAAVKDHTRPVYGVQFHPEVVHTEHGRDILHNFVRKICGLKGYWTPESFVDSTIKRIREQAGDGKVICGLSGGVDSTVAATLLHRAIGDRLLCVFVNNGVLRKNEFSDVQHLYTEKLKLPVKAVDASDLFLDRLKGVSDPEKKRKIIGNTFIEVFDNAVSEENGFTHLAQGTLYPDVIESVSFRGPSVTIKSHHNVGGLPEKMNLKLLEPLRELFKDEVRKVGAALDIPFDFLGRHPFPGPGLSIRILSDVTREKVRLLQEADAIYIEELRSHNLYDSVWQAFVVLLPVQSVGVMGDERTYEFVVGLRAVTSVDGMTADWAHLPYDFLAKVSNRIINEVKGINRVVYDISSKPPATIEWE
ncbi:glutamine-hydrolyzing GMP synthase [Natronogracilivirga saccharolytica]|uniref:GMP synthase [glutamine-hydrolyzing] n=1 Tax=Natronogracilivirga saccharolytica TaxID=2812953 RepID=A0A8J7SAB2_9BACT|nr:glutamine-hydrolyzing GMP synthase [Natronogracilivirga saccharolytica]MBP3192941.1 glutamine-hydrolyzing GMP synthase [Natronogracilivirga saccharolytica]